MENNQETKHNTESLTNNKEFLFQLLIGEPYLYGNPGNITVMTELCVNKFEISMPWCESVFKKKHPEQKNNFKSWLWIIYKDFCKKDIEKTMDYLRQLVKIT